MLPARIKAQLPEGGGNELVIRRGFEQCLILYPMVEFRKVFSKISGLNEFNEEYRKLQRNFLSGVVTVELDNNGRLLIPKNMLQYARLETDAMLVGKGGVMTNSEGQTNPKDGTPARWLDYSGAIEGRAAGVALMDHPANPRHPAPWLNFQNQTFGPAPTHREPYAWEPGESLRFRYRAFFHAGDVRQGKVVEEYAAFTTAPRVRIEPPVRLA